MSDSPLADWLRERQETLGEPEEARAEPGENPSEWPDWATPASAPAGSDGSARWDSPPQGGGGASLRRKRLLLLAVLPWVVAGGLGAAALGGASAPAEGPPPARPAPSAATPGPTPDRVEVDPALGAAAAVAVRLDATTADEGERRYVDIAVPEALRWSGDVAVVTVRAVVLEGSADRWDSARPARYAVPTAWVSGQAVALGEPWALPLAAEPVAQPWEPTAADPGAVARAAEAAGYTDSEILETAGRADLPGLLRASLQARAPGERDLRLHHLWLQAEPEPAVLGSASPATSSRSETP